MQLSGSLQASPQVSGQTTGVAGARNSSHGSGDPKIQWAPSDLTTKPASFFSPRNSRADVSMLPTSGGQRPALQECLGQSNALFGVPSEERPISHSQDSNLRCITYPAHHVVVILPGGTANANLCNKCTDIKATDDCKVPGYGRENAC
ncbi:UNVERIFIED_CONTAM: hypothetical protein FKN15_017607 [Acipenser sinensis]